MDRGRPLYTPGQDHRTEVADITVRVTARVVIVPPTSFQLALMANTGKSTSRSSTLGRQRIRRLLDNPPSNEKIQSEVQLVVDHGNIQVIKGLGAGDQARFLEITDQVSTCHSCPSLRGRF